MSPPQQEGWTEGGASFSEESPSDISEVSAVSEDDDANLAVEHGGDREGLPVTGLQEHTNTDVAEQGTKT